MKRTILMMSISLVTLTLVMGHALTAGCAEGCYGPRAVYSPFQREAHPEEASPLEMSQFAFGLQDTMGTERSITEIKKPGRAFFLSALVPGWGQYYAGSKTRGLVLFGVETVAMTYAIMSHLDGSDKRSDYEAFADQHWIEHEYIDDRSDPSDASWYGYWQQWYAENALDEDLDEDLTHTLPEEKDHDYYEMIGKYDQFLYGWDDIHDRYAPGDTAMAPRDYIAIWSVEGGVDSAHFEPYIGDITSTHRNDYMDMRHESNRAFKRAKTMVGIILFNHVISAIDAARCARNYNVKHAEQQTTLRMRMKKYEGEHIPQLVLTHRFY